ncbi:MAG: carboxypeptidase-like regulatory domain-containing protein, partial [Bacteroidales bacterium]|nr:carboxypeptidase-like regulatory domain-containing protein [Bacteroidales bacterium]
MNSKKLAFFLFCTLAFSICASAARQNETLLRGTAVDVDGVPAGFATAYLSGADGAIVCGTTADADGRFELRAAYGEYKLTVSLVGYKDASQTVRLKDAQMELPAIRLEEDSEMLGEAMVQAVMPKTRITGEGLATSVRGSVLENAGTARDVLGKVPGLIKGRDGLEVIGKGAPQIYINGHKVTDSGELDRLLSHEIQSVEVISNPGAQYDATVRAVVRIRTVKRQGEGIGFNVNMSDAQSLRRKENNDPDGSFNANYRNGGLDVFGGINAAKGSEIQLSDIVQETLGQELFKQDGIIDADFAGKNAGLNGGFN